MKNFHLFFKVIFFFVLYSFMAYKSDTFTWVSGFYYDSVGTIPTLALVSVFIVWMILWFLADFKKSPNQKNSDI